MLYSEGSVLYTPLIHLFTENLQSNKSSVTTCQVLKKIMNHDFSDPPTQLYTENHENNFSSQTLIKIRR